MLNIQLILVTLLLFILDISGNDINESHQLNIEFILITLLVFHLDISGSDINELHPKNISCISFEDSIFNYFSIIFLLTLENENH